MASGKVQRVVYGYNDDGKPMVLTRAWDGQDRSLLTELNNTNKSLIAVVLSKCDELIELIEALGSGSEPEEDEGEELSSEVEVEVEWSSGWLGNNYLIE